MTYLEIYQKKVNHIVLDKLNNLLHLSYNFTIQSIQSIQQVSSIGLSLCAFSIALVKY